MVNVVLSSSILGRHEKSSKFSIDIVLILGGVCLLEGWEGLSLHVDFESVAGGTLPILRRAWERSYHDLKLTTRTLVVSVV